MRADGVTERMRRLDSRAFVDFCADLWRARGYDIEHCGDRFVARRSGERTVVLPWTSSGQVGRLFTTARSRLLRGRLRDDTGTRCRDGEDLTVDVVVSAVEDPWASRLADRHGAQLIGPNALADQLLYGVSRVDADALATQYLGESTATLLAEGPSAQSDAARRSTPTALVAVVGVVCLVLAAGVAGVWSPPATDTRDDVAPPLLTGAGVEPRETTDPTPVTATSVDANATRPQYPPGVGENYLDAWMLARAHATAVSGTSYRLIVRQSDTDALDGNHRWDGVWQHAVVEDERTWLYSVIGYESRVNGSTLVQFTQYTDGEFVYRRMDTRNGTVYDRHPLRMDDDGFGPHTDRSRRYILRYLTTTNVEVDQVSWRPDEYRIVATGRPAYVDGSVSNYTATAFVDESGFVSELTVEFTREDARDEDDESVRFRFEYAAVDDTVVHPPGWHDEAVAATAANSTRE